MKRKILHYDVRLSTGISLPDLAELSAIWDALSEPGRQSLLARFRAESRAHSAAGNPVPAVSGTEASVLH